MVAFSSDSKKSLIKLIDKELNSPIPTPNNIRLIITNLKFVINAGSGPKMMIKPIPNNTVFFFPILFMTRLLINTKIVIIIAGIVAKLSTEAKPSSGFIPW